LQCVLGPIGGLGGISQVVTGLIPGDFYTLSTPWLPDGGNPSQFQVIFDGVTLVNSVNRAASANFLTPSFIVRPTGTTATLAFNFRDGPRLPLSRWRHAAGSRASDRGTAGVGLAGLGFRAARAVK
jgi:hypothetical protein